MRAMIVLLVLCMTVTTAQAGTPTETVKSQVDQAIQALSQTLQAGPQAKEQRRQEIRRLADSLFDFAEMSRRALGRHWADRTPGERDEFVGLFTELMARAYIGKIDRYTGEPIAYVGERIDGDQASVQSRIVTAKGSEVPVEYRLHRVREQWAVYDILIGNVSLVATYRSQFDRVIKTESFGALLQRLRTKEREVAAAGPTG